MGQIFNLSKMGLLEEMMLSNVYAFIQALEQQQPRVVEVVKACRALEADIVCEIWTFHLNSVRSG